MFCFFSIHIRCLHHCVVFNVQTTGRGSSSFHSLVSCGMKSLLKFCFVLSFIVAKVSSNQISSDSVELCKIQLEALLGDKNKTDNEWASQSELHIKKFK